MTTALKTIVEPHRRFPYDAAMYNSTDSKAWKAAKKAGLIVHKVPGIVRHPEGSSVFVVCYRNEDGKLSHLRNLFTAEEVIEEAKRDSHFRFSEMLSDMFSGVCPGLDGEPETDEQSQLAFARKVDVPCVSSGV